MRNYSLFFVTLIFLISCQENSRKIIDTSMIDVNYSISRFEVDFYESDGKNIETLKKTYPMLFPEEISDSVWRSKINDRDEQALYIETQKLYSNIDKLENDLTNLFKHIKYYSPEFNSPDVITLLSNIDYNYRVIYTDKKLYLSLDAYLGATHPFYDDYPDYIKENNTQERILVDIANKIIQTKIKPSNNRTFLAKMIEAGKKLYLLDLYLPLTTDPIKMGYSKDKLDWALSNEEEVWRYFIENKLLYNTDTKLNQRFLNDAPFSKFYLTEDRNSPGRIGQWIGWQIVASFMENNDVSLENLVSTRAEEIFKKSKYKPRK